MSAAFLFAYLALSGDDFEDGGVLRTRVTELRGQPWLWSAIGNTDYLRFTMALPLCNRAEMDPKELQTKMSEVLHALPDVAPPAEPEPEEEDDETGMTGATV